MTGEDAAPAAGRKPAGSKAAARRAAPATAAAPPDAPPPGDAALRRAAAPREPAPFARSGKAGFRAVALAAAPALGAAGARRGIAERRLFTEWRAVVGAELAALCRPERMVWPRREKGEGATLVVSADGPGAVELAHLADLIVERVNQVHGWRAVARLRITQSGAAGARAARAAPRAQAPVDAATAADITAVADEGLRAALGRLGASIRARAARADRSRT
jgi:hypothetical protein